MQSVLYFMCLYSVVHTCRQVDGKLTATVDEIIVKLNGFRINVLVIVLIFLKIQYG